jgi:hypothetical protein
VSVTRYRDVADMPPPDRLDPAERRTYARIKELWRSSSRRLPPLFEPGVTRYRSIDESWAARERATIRRMRAVRAARRVSPDE